LILPIKIGFLILSVGTGLGNWAFDIANEDWVFDIASGNWVFDIASGNWAFRRIICHGFES